MFEAVHGLDHPGIRQTRKNIARSFIWLNMDRSIRSLVKACVACQKAKVYRHDKQPWQHFDLPGARFDHLHVDFVGPLTTATSGYRYMLTIVDRYSRYPMAVPVTSTSAQTAINAIVDKWFAVFGLPLSITTDQGPAFRSGTFGDFMKKFNIEWKPSSTYHPQSNGLVERFHRRLKEALTAVNHSWTKDLPWILLGIRNAKGPDIEYSPNEALFGANVRVPMSIELQTDPVPPEQYTMERCEHPLPQPKQGRWHRENLKQSGTDLSQVQFVLIKRHQKRPLQFTYAGPFRLIKHSDKTATVDYQGKPLIISRDRIKPVVQHDNRFFFSPTNDDNLLLIS